MYVDIGIPSSHVHIPDALNTATPAPHFASEHIHKPNVIVAHLKDAIEVIHLYTGRTVTKLKAGEKTTTTDINSDNILDHIKISSQYGMHINQCTVCLLC